MEVNEKLTLKAWLSLIGMTCATFLFNSAEFMPIGLLSTIAEDFGSTEAEVGLIVSLYAWAVMTLSLPLLVIASKYSMKALLIFNLVLFVVSNALASIATGFMSLLGARLVLACAHAIFWSIAAPAAVRLVSHKHKALAMSTLIAGSSLATILGMPLGRVIGLQLGWRMTFLSMAIVALIILVYMYVFFPKLEKTKPFSFKELPELLHNKMLLGIYFISASIPTAQFIAYSYIEPFMKYIVKMSPEMISVSLMVFGITGFLGSVIFSKTFNKHAGIFLPAMLLGLTICLFLMGLAASSELAMIVLFIFWGIFVTCFNMACQADLLQITTMSTAPVAMSIFSGIFNFGIGGGTFVGGLICDHIGIAYIGYGAGLVAIIGTLFSVWLTRKIHPKT